MADDLTDRLEQLQASDTKHNYDMQYTTGSKGGSRRDGDFPSASKQKPHEAVIDLDEQLWRKCAKQVPCQIERIEDAAVLVSSLVEKL